MNLTNTKYFTSLLKKIYSLKEIFILIICFTATNSWFRKLTEINNTDFKKTVLSNDADQFFKGGTYLLIPIAVVFILFFIKRRTLTLTWQSLEAGKHIRLIVCTAVFSMAWAHASYPFDYYVNEIVWLERIMVLLLAVLVFWRPFFIFCFVLYPIATHFGEPYLMGHWSIMELPTKIPLLFSAQLLVWLLFPNFKYTSKSFVFMLLCIIGCVYFPAGFAKLRQGWIMNDQMHLLFTNMYSDGWMGVLSNETASAFTRLLAKSDLLLKFGAIIVELGCFLILLKKQFSVRFFLIGFIVFHLLVFLLTGICFWPWVALEVAFLILLQKNRPFYQTIKNYSSKHIILASVLIITSTKWLKPSVFIWHDSPVNYTYKFKVEDNKGRITEIPSNYFWPKYYEFAWSDGFHFIHDYPTINVNWGVTVDGKTVSKLQKLKTAKQVLEYEKQSGISFYDLELSKEFDAHMIRFVKQKKYKLTMNPIFRLLSAPQQRLVLFSGNNIYNGKEKIKKIHIYQHLTFFDNLNYNTLRSRKIKTIEIP